MSQKKRISIYFSHNNSEHCITKTINRSMVEILKATEDIFSEISSIYKNVDVVSIILFNIDEG